MFWQFILHYSFAIGGHWDLDAFWSWLDQLKQLFF
jgi:hypothetical protein